MSAPGQSILHATIRSTERRSLWASIFGWRLGYLFVIAGLLWACVLSPVAGLMGWGQAFLYSGAPLLTIGLTWAFVQWRTR